MECNTTHYRFKEAGMLHAVAGWIILNICSDCSAFTFRFKQLNYLHHEDKLSMILCNVRSYFPWAQYNIPQQAQCNIPQQAHYSQTYMDQDVCYRNVTFRHAGYKSTKFFSSLELLITPNKQTNKATKTSSSLNVLEK
jgi:hypothetical protein